MKKGKKKAKIDWPSILAAGLIQLIVGMLLRVFEKNF